MTAAQPTEHCSTADVAAWIALGLSGVVIVSGAVCIVVGAVVQPQDGWFALVLSEDLVLLWITAASTAHIVFVPAFCVLVARQDHRRKMAGIAVPAPRSVWRGHEAVFGKIGDEK